MASGYREGVQGNTKKVFVFVGLASLFFLIESQVAIADTASDRLARQRNAIAVARTGNHQDAIRELEALHKLAPDDVSIRQDLIQVYAWSGNCPHALRLYRTIEQGVLREPSLALAVADCLRESEFPVKSITVLTPALHDNPGDQDLKESYQQSRQEVAKSRPWFSYSGIEARTADIGSQETRFETELSRTFSEETKAYVRALLSSGIDPVLPDGSMNRVGVGVQHRLIGGLQFKGEVSSGIGAPANPAWLIRIDSARTERLSVHGEYTSYSEEIPLPAAAQNITADRLGAGMEYHSSGFEFEGSLDIFRSLFSDGNLRKGVNTNMGYAYSRVPDRWRRIGLEIEHEDNSLAGPAYFNPTDGNRVVVFHSTEFPFKTRFKRHIDILTIKAGLYAQAGFGSAYIAEARYQRKYDLTDHSSLEWSASLGSNVYDGVRETDSILQFSYSRSF